MKTRQEYRFVMTNTIKTTIDQLEDIEYISEV